MGLAWRDGGKVFAYGVLPLSLLLTAVGYADSVGRAQGREINAFCDNLKAQAKTDMTLTPPPYCFGLDDLTVVTRNPDGTYQFYRHGPPPPDGVHRFGPPPPPEASRFR